MLIVQYFICTTSNILWYIQPKIETFKRFHGSEEDDESFVLQIILMGDVQPRKFYPQELIFQPNMNNLFLVDFQAIQVHTGCRPEYKSPCLFLFEPSILPPWQDQELPSSQSTRLVPTGLELWESNTLREFSPATVMSMLHFQLPFSRLG